MRFSKFRVFSLRIIVSEYHWKEIYQQRGQQPRFLSSISLDPVSDPRPTGSRFPKLRHGKHGDCQLPEIFATMCQDDLSWQPLEFRQVSKGQPQETRYWICRCSKVTINIPVTSTLSSRLWKVRWSKLWKINNATL